MRVCAFPSVLSPQRLRGGGKMTTKCRKCGNLKRKDGKPCAQPCPVDEYGEPCSRKSGGKAPRPQPGTPGYAAYAKKRADEDMLILRDMRAESRAKKRADAQELAQAKAKKPKLMREIEQ